MNAELTRKLLKRFSILYQDYDSPMTQISTAQCLRQISPLLHRRKNRRFVAQLLTELYGFFISKVEQGGTRTAKAERRNAGRNARGDLQLPAIKTKTKPTWLVDSALPGSERIISTMRETRVSPLPSLLLQGIRSRA